MNPNIYSGGGAIDRAALLRRDGARLAACFADPASRVVPLWRSQNLVQGSAAAPRALCLPVAEAAWVAGLAEPPVFLGLMGGVPHFAVDLSAHEDPLAVVSAEAGAAFVDLRSVGALLSQEEGALLAYARGLMHWHRVQRFCGRCGAPTASSEGGHVRRCTGPDCGTEHFPRTDPAVIVLVSAGDQCLLGRQARWRPGMFSTLAGFVEPGETMEEAVAREVMEEAGVSIGRVRYHSSQPWPFPGSLMIGFMAEAEQVVVPVVDSHELEAAAWFTRAEIADFAAQGKSLPGPDSIARRLIEDWLRNGA